MTSKKMGDSVSMTKAELQEIMVVLKNIEQKNAKIEEYQTLSYKWNLQHHENLKKVMETLNQISKFLKGNLHPDELTSIAPVDNMSINGASSSKDPPSQSKKRYNRLFSFRTTDN
eukprot:Phypoly_transcript_13718.p1 GENE.Phypoly_transcript_13718~~Phypoly_transcript_13718.p1  ORF type:complete len:115 (+),score=12.85 Phypoly_transcript_13718:156-500(+)